MTKRQMLLAIYAGSKPTGRWLDLTGTECNRDTPGAYWAEYDAEEQRRWLDHVCEMIETFVKIPEELANSIPQE